MMIINLMHDLLIGEMSGESLLGSYNWISLSNRHLISYAYGLNIQYKFFGALRLNVNIGLHNEFI